MDPRGNVVGRPARVQRRSRSWDLQWGVDPFQVSQTLSRLAGASPGLSLTWNPSRDLSLMPWEAVRARGGASWIARVRIPAHAPESDSLCPATHLTWGSGAGSAPGRTPVGPSCTCERGGGVMLSSSRPPRGGDRPGTSVPSVGPSGRPLEERDGLLVSGPRSSAEGKMGWEELGSNRRKKGRKS